jgi:peroxiredoxin
MKNSITLIIACCLLGLILVFNIVNYKKNSKANIKLKMLNIDLMVIGEKNMEYRNNLFLSLNFNNQFISDFSVENEKGKILLSQLTKSKSKLIFYFSDTGCERCYMNELSFIASDSILNKQIIIIGDFQNKRKYIGFINDNSSFSYNIYLIPSDFSEKFEIFNCKTPVYFIIDNDFSIKHCFFPNSSLQEEKKYYFETLKKRGELN